MGRQAPDRQRDHRSGRFLAVPVEIFTALDFSTDAYGIYRLWMFVAVAFLLPVAVLSHGGS